MWAGMGWTKGSKGVTTALDEEARQRGAEEMTTEHPLVGIGTRSWAGNRGKGGLMPLKGGLMPLTTAEIEAKVGVEEGQPLYLLALLNDEDGIVQGYGGTLPEWVADAAVPREHGRVLFAFTSAEKAEEFAKKTEGTLLRGPDPGYPKVPYIMSDWENQRYWGLGHVEPQAADLRDIAYVVAYFSHSHTLAIDAGPYGEGRYIPLEDLGWSRDLVEAYKALPVDTHLDRFFGETAENAERAFREGRVVEGDCTYRVPAFFGS
jgi:hypothetical protein